MGTGKKQQEPPKIDLGVLDDNTVILSFGKLIAQMIFTPEQARDLGLGFIEMATRAGDAERVRLAGQFRTTHLVTTQKRTN